MNEEQTAFWNGPSGERWAREQVERDAMLGPYGDAAIAAAHVEHGDSVLDVGCGCGTTTLALADLAGAPGRARGVDLSLPMVERARQRAAGRANVSFEVADASVASGERGAFDVLYSRFGVMFFDDPAGAFGALRASLKSRARVAFVCWTALADNPWAKIPFDAAASAVGAPPPSPPGAPGPFAFADDARVRSILERAGFAGVEVARFDTKVVYGATLDEAAERLVSIGPASRLLVDHDATTAAKVVRATREALAPYATAGSVAVPGAAWVVTARNL